MCWIGTGWCCEMSNKFQNYFKCFIPTSIPTFTKQELERESNITIEFWDSQDSISIFLSCEGGEMHRFKNLILEITSLYLIIP